MPARRLRRRSRVRYLTLVRSASQNETTTVYSHHPHRYGLCRLLGQEESPVYCRLYA